MQEHKCKPGLPLTVEDRGDGKWYLYSDSGRGASPIKFCPFCGKDLEAMSELVRGVAGLIGDCWLRQSELFEEKFSPSERKSRTFFDTTDINTQATEEYAVHILKVVAEKIASVSEVGPTQTDLDCFSPDFAMGLREGAKRERGKTLALLREQPEVRVPFRRRAENGWR